MTPTDQLRSALRSGNTEQAAYLAELIEQESTPPRARIAARTVTALESATQRSQARRVVMVQYADGTAQVDPAFADGLSAEIELTRRIWRDAEPIEY